MPTRERMATPFHVASPWTAASYPRSASASPSRPVNSGSATLVSWRHTTSGRRWSSQGTSRRTRCRSEFTFQVAILKSAHQRRGGDNLDRVGQREAGGGWLIIALEPSPQL